MGTRERVRWLAPTFLAMLLLSGCTIYVGPSVPNVTSTPAEVDSAAVFPVPSPSDSESPLQTAPTATAVRPLEPASSGSTESFPDCPPSVDLPDGIDPRFCGGIPADAMDGGRHEKFVTPSGNIACLMEDGALGCEALDTVMIEDLHNPEGDGVCNGFWLHETASLMCHSEPVLWDGHHDDPRSWPRLAYGESVAVRGHVCGVEESGLTCWNSDTGHGFLLARASYADW